MLADARLMQRYALFSESVAALVAVVGVLVLFGWSMHITALKAVAPGYVTMKPMTPLRSANSSTVL